MSFLTDPEIMRLLDTMDPNEILTEKKDELDETGRQYLGELQKDIQSGKDMFEEFGRQFREADDAKSSNAEEKPFRSKVEKPMSLPLMRRSISAPWALAAAAIFAAIAILPNLQDWGERTNSRGRGIVLEDLRPLDEKLVESLYNRADLLYEIGKKKKNRDYRLEARDNLLQAYELEPENVELLSLLARVYESLGNKKKSDRYFDEWQAARALKKKEDNP